MSNSKRPWLDKTYAERKTRTVELTLKAIAHLKNENSKISIASIISTSKLVDTNGLGISSSALLTNQEAKTAYENARNWRKPTQAPIRKVKNENPLALQIKVDRNHVETCRRLKTLTKRELIERLILVEESYATLKLKWLESQNNILNSMVSG